MRLTAAATSQTDDPQPDNDSDSATIAVEASADLSVDFIGGSTYSKGSLAVQVIRLRNLGPSDAADGTLGVSTTTQPARTAIEAPAGWTCVEAGGRWFSASCAANDDVVLASGAEALFTVVVDTSGRLMPPAYTLRAGAASAANDPAPQDNTAEKTVTGGR